MLGTILMAYLMAGMLAQLLRQSGLITALIWGISKLGMNAGWIPLIGFIACLLISTSCGTSTGSVAAVAPVPGRMPRPTPMSDERRRMRPRPFHSCHVGKLMRLQSMAVGSTLAWTS